MEKKAMQERNQELINKYYTRGIASSEKGEVELAIEDYTNAIALNPKFTEGVLSARACSQQKRRN